jgi:alanyl-tRNA synthetase
MKFPEIRKHFLDFYTEEGYDKLPRAPLMAPSIPMSFVMSAGQRNSD